MSYTRRIVGVIGGGGTGGTTVVSGMAAVSLLGNNTSGALALVSSGTLRLAGGNNITLSQNGQSVTISGANSNPGTYSIWEPVPLNAVITQAKLLGQSTLNMWPIYVPMNVSATQFIDLLSVSVSSSSDSSFAASFSESIGVYTLTGSTLNLITASSGATNVQFTNTAAVSFNSLTGVKAFTVPLTFNATPGNYWIGALVAVATANANWVTISNLVCSQANIAFNGQIGEIINKSRGPQRGGGLLSVQTAALPAAVALSDMLASTLASNNQLYMQFVGI